jgi:hypothetical protein
VPRVQEGFSSSLHHDGIASLSSSPPPCGDRRVSLTLDGQFYMYKCEQGRSSFRKKVSRSYYLASRHWFHEAKWPNVMVQVTVGIREILLINKGIIRSSGIRFHWILLQLREQDDYHLCWWVKLHLGTSRWKVTFSLELQAAECLLPAEARRHPTHVEAGIGVVKEE